MLARVGELRYQVTLPRYGVPFINSVHPFHSCYVRGNPHKDEAELAFIHLTAEIQDICSAPESDQHNLIRFLEENPHLVSTAENQSNI